MLQREEGIATGGCMIWCLAAHDRVTSTSLCSWRRWMYIQTPQNRKNVSHMNVIIGRSKRRMLVSKSESSSSSSSSSWYRVMVPVLYQNLHSNPPLPASIMMMAMLCHLCQSAIGMSIGSIPMVVDLVCQTLRGSFLPNTIHDPMQVPNLDPLVACRRHVRNFRTMRIQMRMGVVRWSNSRGVRDFEIRLEA